VRAALLIIKNNIKMRMANNNTSDKQGNSIDNRSKRGFASMDENKQREIASKGGKAAHEKGTAHEFTSAEGQAAGRRGGQARQNNAANDNAHVPENVDVGIESDLLEDFDR
jgi:uncharacterized protein